MRHAKRLLLLSLLLCACLENEEEIVVRPDGTARVTLRAKGDLPDLAGGYPIPLDAPWVPESEDARRWIAEVGAWTGGAGVLERARAAWPAEKRAEGEAQSSPEGEPKEAELELVVSRDVASLDELPSGFADPADPYGSASLQRETTLEIRRRDRQRVYVFERIYRGSDHARLDWMRRLEGSLDEQTEEEFGQVELSRGRLRSLRRKLADVQEDTAELFVRDALVGAYTESEASLPPYLIGDAVERVRGAVGALITLETLEELQRLALADEEEAAGHLLERYQEDHRDAIRRELSAAFSEGGVDDATIHGILFALEWGFSAHDHRGDLGDEDFELSVTLPGVLVGGNFHASEGSRASWSFDGTELLEGDVVLRAVSVLEER